jgi:hypothetical protein
VSLSKKEGPTGQEKKLLQSPKLNPRQSLQKDMKQSPKHRHNKEAKKIIDSKEHHVATKKETNQEAHGGIPTLQDDIKDRETIPWHQRHDKDQDQGGKATVGHHVHLPLGWMDGCTWYQLATLLSQSYCMVSSHVSRMKHVKGDGM